MNFGFAGVSGTGKTTLFDAVIKKFGARINGLTEVKVEDVVRKYRSCFAPAAKIDFTNSSDNWFVNLRLLDMQKQAEKNATGSTFVADSCSLVKLVFYLFLVSQFDEPWKVDAFVMDTIELTKRQYSLLFYLPFDPSRERIRPHPFKSRYMLSSMDAILRDLLFSTGIEQAVEIIELPKDYQARELVMFEELKKRGMHA